MIRSKKIAFATAVTLAGASCFFAAGGVFCAVTLHVPRTVGATPLNAKDVELSAIDGAKLRAWWMRPAAPNGDCVIVLHGIADSRQGSAGFAPMFLAQGYSVLAPDSRAHGESGGNFVTYGLLEKYDVLGWAHWMSSNGCRKIYGLGESLGASILIQAAAVEPIFAAIVSECPYADLREIAEYRMRQVLRLPPVLVGPIATLVIGSALSYARLFDGLDFRQVSPVTSIAHSSTPILLIHGLADIKTPPSQSEKLAAANPRDPLWLVPNARHTGASAAAPDEFRLRVLTWFASH
ncbi:MAG TPA: alpha/beta fold hydrolase [Bryobacteraceae bacterium]|nr:alpha/beta fold hydrolase [Bryobacteraceae bacterium]